MSLRGWYRQSIKARVVQRLGQGPATLWELLRDVDASLRHIFDALNELYEAGQIEVGDDGTIRLRAGAPRASGFRAAACQACAGKGIAADGGWDELLSRFREAVKGRPEPVLELFQGYMVPEDVVARLALMNVYGDLEGKRLLIIGDDDMLSIAAGLSGLPSKVTVLEADRRVVDFINSRSRELGLGVEAFQYNVKDPLPEWARGSYDVFSSEPLESFSGLRAFLSRGAAGLSEGGVMYFGLSNYEANIRKWEYVQRMLVRMGFVITEVRPGFSRYDLRYPTADYEGFGKYLKFRFVRNLRGTVWYTSALIRAVAVKPPRPVVGPERPTRVRLADPEDDLSYSPRG